LLSKWGKYALKKWGKYYVIYTWII
jgi:hypothetical protein